MRRRPEPTCIEHRAISIDDCLYCVIEQRSWVAQELLEEVEALLPPEIAEAYRDDNPWLA